MPRVLLAAFAAAGLADILGEAAGATAVTTIAKPLIIPLLLAWLVVVTVAAGAVSSSIRWLGVGLGCAWIGDLLLMGTGDGFFVGGIAAFLAMQVCYLIAFVRIPGPGLVRAWRIAAVPYVAIWLAMNVLVSGGVGALRIPVLVYSAVLLTMAAAALDLVLRVPQALGWRVASGALVFVLSDALLALVAFGPLTTSRGLSAAVMATYVVAQAMIVTGMAGIALARAHPSTRQVDRA